MNKLLTLILISIGLCLSAQRELHQVFILNEGRYNYTTEKIEEPISVGVYNPTSKSYKKVITIADVRFANDLQIDGKYIFVSADNVLIKYDIEDFTEIDRVSIEGIRKIAFWNDLVLITRGEFKKTFDSYLQAYYKTDLEPAYTWNTIVGPQFASEGVVVVKDRAYIAVNNGFEWGKEVGKISIIDLQSKFQLANLDLGDNGKNPDNLMTDGRSIITVNNKDFSGSSISTYQIATGELKTSDLLNISAGCGTSTYAKGHVYYQAVGGTVIHTFDPNAQQTVASQQLSKSFYGLSIDELQGHVYASETDYTSFGRVFIYDASYNEIGSFDCGLSPGTITFDYRTMSNTSDQDKQVIVQYQSEGDQLRIKNLFTTANYTIFNTTGVTLQEGFVNIDNPYIQLNHLLSGSYVLQIDNSNYTFIKY